MTRKVLYIYLLIQVLGLSSFSQQTKRYSFTHYGTASGLASNDISDVTQDADGYIWVATTGGLQRFDGIRFNTYYNRKNDSTSIPANFVRRVMVDKKKNLWVVSGWIRVGIFDTKTFTYRDIPVKPSDESSIHAEAEKELIEDEAGNIYLLLRGIELLKFDPARNEIVPAASLFHLPPEWHITGFIPLRGTKKYFIGTLNGVAVYNSQTGQLSYKGHNVENEVIVERAGQLPYPGNFFEDQQGRVWFDWWRGAGPELSCYDTRNQVLIYGHYNFGGMVRGYHELKGMMQQRDGTLWIRGLGIFGRYLEKEDRFQLVHNQDANEQSVFYKLVSSFFEDNENNIWVATSNNGLYRFNPKEQFFTNIHHNHRITNEPGKGGVMSFALTNQGTLLTGTWGDGLYRYDKDYNPIPLAIRGLKENDNPSMWSLCLSRDSNTIWMSSQPGIWMYDQAAGSAKYYNPPIMKSKTVRQIAEDRFGNLWMGTQNIGVFKWDAKKGKKNFNDGVSPFTGVPVSLVHKINIDKKGHVWVCTASQGLYVIDPAADKVILHFGDKEPTERKLLWNSVADALQYDDSTFVIAAKGFSLYSTTQQRITQTISLPDIFSGDIQSLQRDKQGYLWISSTSGLYRLNIRNEIFIHFDRVDGIVNDQFVVAASMVMPDGKILFGADNQYVFFDPEKVQINNPSPDITITGFTLMNKPLLVDSLLKKDRVELGPKDNSLVIEFSGLSFNSAYRIRYKLENLDKEWKVADKNFQAVYSYLPPGTYTFLARSEDAEGVPGKNITRLVIHIKPPFWKTWWFFCVAALVIAGVFYWLDQQRVKKLIALQNVRSEIASNLHEDVNTTLSNINLLSELARIKADKDIARSKEYIDQISSKSHNMIIAMDDILWSIDPQNDNMEKSLLRMMEFADTLKSRHGANIELALDKKVRLLKLDMKIRHEVLIIFKEALRMIVQYSGGKETLVHIDLFKNKLSVKLQDASASLDKSTAEIDNAIRELNNHAAQIGADLDVQYNKSGIAIILLVPVK